MAVDIVARGMAAEAMSGGGGGGSATVSVGTITASTTWSGSDPYSQTVTVTGVTTDEKSIVDIQPTATQLASLIADGVEAMLVENNAGTLTLYALGATPSSELTLQCVVMASGG